MDTIRRFLSHAGEMCKSLPLLGIRVNLIKRWNEETREVSTRAIACVPVLHRTPVSKSST